MNMFASWGYTSDVVDAGGPAPPASPTTEAAATNAAGSVGGKEINESGSCTNNITGEIPSFTN
jgi:hypothetical protein